jgi:Holliday junction resolvase RusA-like endonuclease
MIRVKIKPLSVNEAWQGKRFKTVAYNLYQRDVMLLLRPLKLPDPPYKLSLVFGVSSPLADIDNPVKPFIDILQKKYGFNDRYIFELNVKKEVVKKGLEFIDFSINSNF